MYMIASRNFDFFLVFGKLWQTFLKVTSSEPIYVRVRIPTPPPQRPGNLKDFLAFVLPGTSTYEMTCARRFAKDVARAQYPCNLAAAAMRDAVENEST